MKKSVKIISVLCMIALLIGIVPAMGVAAEGAALTLTPSSANVKAGEEFTVTVALENNPGFGALAFVMPVNTDVFEFVGEDKGTSICGQFGICSYDEVTNAYKFNGLTGDPTENVTVDGTLVVVTLKAKTDAVLGEYTIAANVDASNTNEAFGSLITVADGSVKVNVIANVATSEIIAADVMLGKDISIQYFVNLDPAHAGAKMKFTVNGKEAVVSGAAGDKENLYVYTFKGIPPQCMGDIIKAELILDEEVLAVKDDYSVLQYCKNMLASTPAELDMTQAKFDAMKTLIADLLEYGAKTQLFMDYKTDALVNKDITGATEFEELTATVKKVNTPVIKDVCFRAAGVYFDYTNSLFVKFTAPGMEKDDIRINFNNTTYYTLEDCELFDEATSLYYLRLDDISVLNYGATYNVTIEKCEYDADFDEWTYTSLQRLRYSVNSYVHSMQNNEDVKMADLAKALYNYGVSASAFDAAN